MQQFTQSPMQAAIDPALNFNTAYDTLLTPYALNDSKLDTVFGQIMQHQVDYADLYFQYSRSESWSLEEGIVKSGSFAIEQGVGVRAVSGEKTAFAYSDDIGFDALAAAAQSLPDLPTGDGVEEVEPAARAGKNLAHRAFGQATQRASKRCGQRASNG